MCQLNTSNDSINRPRIVIFNKVSSAFRQQSVCSLITLFNILMNKKTRHIGKRKAGSSARKRLRKLHTSEYENSCFTKKLFFISKKIQLIQISYNQQCHPLHLGNEQYKQLPQKKKRKKKSQEREREREREEERMRTGEKMRRKMRRNKRKGKKRRKKRRKWRERY